MNPIEVAKCVTAHRNSLRVQIGRTRRALEVTESDAERVSLAARLRDLKNELANEESQQAEEDRRAGKRYARWAFK